MKSLLALLAILGLTGCPVGFEVTSDQSSRNETTDPTTTTTTSTETSVTLKSLSLSGSTSLAGQCDAITVTGTGSDDKTYTPDSDTTVSLSASKAATFYSDSSCTSQITSVTLAKGATTATFYVKSDRVNIDGVVAKSGSVESSELTVTFDSYIQFYSASNEFSSNRSSGYDMYVRSLLLQKNYQMTFNNSSAGLQSDSDGQQGTAAVSGAGRYAVYISDCKDCAAVQNQFSLIRYDRELGVSKRVDTSSSSADANSATDESFYDIDSSGTYVVFSGEATNLVASDANARKDVFIKNMDTDAITRLSKASDGTEGDNASSAPEISGDGAYVVFQSNATNLVTSDTNATTDVFLVSSSGSGIKRVSVTSAGGQATGASSAPSISNDGSLVVFQSAATDLVTGDTNAKSDIFLHVVSTGVTTRISVADDGTEGDNSSSDPHITPDGKYVVYYSTATNLVSGDTNGASDVFLYDIANATVKRISVASDGTEGNSSSSYAFATNCSNYVYFYSPATNLVSNDTNARGDVFLYHIPSGSIERASVADDGTQGSDWSFIFVEI